MPGPGWFMLGEEEKKEVLSVLESKELCRYKFDDFDDEKTPKVFQFEQAFASLTKAPYCLAVNSGTSALLAGLAGLGIGPGDEVLVPGYTFIASIASIVHAGAVPILVEIDDSLTMDPEDIEKKMTRRTKAIMPVHMLGAPSEMDSIMKIARKHNLKVIEDVAQACGASYKSKMLGSIGDAGAFSLNQFKTITAGDGGMLLTRHEEVHQRAFAFHDHGFKPYRMGLIDDSSFFGLNLRMNEVTGALALAQVRKLPNILKLLSVKKRLFKDAIGIIPGMSYRKLHDVSGECSTLLVLQFETSERAEKVAGQLECNTLVRSGKHYYGNMLQLLNKRTVINKGCPFHCSAFPAHVEYHANMLPRTDNILSRSIALSIGVRDSYLGSNFGISILSSENEIEQTAVELKKKIRDIW